MPEFRDVEEAVAHLARFESLPFSMYGIGAAGHEIRVEVDHRSVHEARAWFDRHRFRLADGRGVPVAVVGRRGASWTTDPVDGPNVRPTDIDLAALVGCTAQQAARSANGAGWSVRAYEAEAFLTAEYQPRRVNLRYDDDELVTAADIG